MRIRLRTVLAAPLLFCALACSNKSSNSVNPALVPAPVKDARVADCEPGRPGGRLVFAALGEPKSYNALLAMDQNTLAVAQRLHAGLVALNRLTHKIEPALAKSWTFSADRRQLDLRLREGVRFSDGHALTADDVVFTFTALTDRRLNLRLSTSFIVDGQPVRAEKLGDYAVRLHYPKPTAQAEQDLSEVPILPRHKLEAAYQAAQMESAWTPAAPPQEVVGLGPFKVKEYAAGQRLVLERNPHYWKTDKNGIRLPYLDTMVFLFIPDQNAQRLRLESGEVDMLDDLRPDDFAALQRVAGPKGLMLADVGPDINSEFLWFNQNPEANPQTGKPHLAPHKYRWFSDVRFRRAVAHAIDRRALIEAGFLGKASPSYGPFNESNKLWSNPSVPRYDYDPGRARALLREAGFNARAGAPLLDPSGQRVEFSLLTNAGNKPREKLASLIQQDLAKVGVTVRLTTLETGAMVQSITTSAYEACLFVFRNGNPDPSSQQSVWLSASPMHAWYPRQKTPASEWERRLDQLMTGQMVAFDFGERKRLVDEAQQVIAENVPFIYLVSKNILVGARRHVGNFKPSVLDHRTLWNSDELYLRAGS